MDSVLNALAITRIATIEAADAAKTAAQAKLPPKPVLDAINQARDAYFNGDATTMKTALATAATAANAVVVQPVQVVGG